MTIAASPISASHAVPDIGPTMIQQRTIRGLCGA